MADEHLHSIRRELEPEEFNRLIIEWSRVQFLVLPEFSLDLGCASHLCETPQLHDTLGFCEELAGFPIHACIRRGPSYFFLSQIPAWQGAAHHVSRARLVYRGATVKEAPWVQSQQLRGDDLVGLSFQLTFNDLEE